MTELRHRGLNRIRAFAESWSSSLLHSVPTPAERALIEEALVDFLLAESALAPSTASTAREALDALYAEQDVAARDRQTAIVSECVIDLAERLDRQEDANLILREHLIMLSEAARQHSSPRHRSIGDTQF